jgi:hypothetical protein
MNGELRAVPDALRREQFDRVVVLSRSGVARVNLDRRGVISSREIANLGVVVLLVLLSQLLLDRAFRIEARRRRRLLYSTPIW